MSTVRCCILGALLTPRRRGWPLAWTVVSRTLVHRIGAIRRPWRARQRPKTQDGGWLRWQSTHARAGGQASAHSGILHAHLFDESSTDDFNRHPLPKFTGPSRFIDAHAIPHLPKGTCRPAQAGRRRVSGRPHIRERETINCTCIGQRDGAVLPVRARAHERAHGHAHDRAGDYLRRGHRRGRTFCCCWG